jgi:signal peptidase I
VTAPPPEPVRPDEAPPVGADPDVAPVVLPASKRRARKPTRLRGAIEWVVVIGGSLAVALLVNAFLFQPFRIPSSSMYPTLKVGDRVVVNKMSYHVHPVHRSDVVVFGQPKCNSAGSTDVTHPLWATCSALAHVKDLVKRVVALPGETVSIHDDHVYIDGKQLAEPYLAKGTTIVPVVAGCSFPGTYRVPEGYVFVMGDNRTVSFDSRCFGPIPESLIVGRAFLRLWPLGRLAAL